jgi:hypothetical protein
MPIIVRTTATAGGDWIGGSFIPARGKKSRPRGVRSALWPHATMRH